MIDPTASDWSDLDLLTISEAAERLAAETVVVRRELAQLRSTLRDRPDSPETIAGIAARERRLVVLQESVNRLPRRASKGQE
jgi:hypothetical protein